MAVAPDPTYSYSSLVRTAQQGRAPKKPATSGVNAVYPKLKFKAATSTGGSSGLGISPGDQAIMDWLGQYQPKAPPSMNNAQLLSSARADVSALIDPVLARIRSANTLSTRQGLAGIQGRSAAVQANLAPLAGQVSDYYGQAGADLGKQTAALGAYLTGAGAKLGAGVDAAAAAAGQEAPPSADAVVGLGQGAAGEAAGRGFADLAQLTGNRVANVDYFSKLPGIAAMQGLADEGAFRTSQSNALGDQLGQVTSQVPGLVRQTLGDYRTAQQQQQDAYASQRQAYAGLAAGFLGDAQGRAATVTENAKSRAAAATQARLDRQQQIKTVAMNIAAQRYTSDADRNAQIMIAANSLGLNYAQLKADVDKANADRAAQVSMNAADNATSLAANAADNATAIQTAGMAASTAASQLAEDARQFNKTDKRTQQTTKLSAADTARTGAANLATTLGHGRLAYQNEPVLPLSKSANGKYVMRGGSQALGPFTNDPAQAEIKTVRVATPAAGFAQAFKQAYSMYGTSLKALGYTDAEAKTIIREGIVAGGLKPGS